MKFSVVTPSFRSSSWLKLCIASVADQEGVSFEHLVQDACSDDGTQDWLPRDSRVKACIEKDQGMYDAINRGLRRAAGEILSYLNADEQYLPGALAAVGEAFDREPGLDILLADSVVVDERGEFICCRKSLVPWALLAWTFVPMTTASLFFRRRVLDEFNLFFDTRWRGIGDVMWMRDALRLKLRIGVLRRYTSAFTETGDNLSLSAGFLRERELTVRMRPWWAQGFRWPLLQLHRARALFNGVYAQRPFTYSIYTREHPERRTDFFVAKPTAIWWQRHSQAKPA
jgi:glycosyltransferase involved in cell wall biosynthesis